MSINLQISTKMSSKIKERLITLDFIHFFEDLKNNFGRFFYKKNISDLATLTNSALLNFLMIFV